MSSAKVKTAELLLGKCLPTAVLQYVHCLTVTINHLLLATGCFCCLLPIMSHSWRLSVAACMVPNSTLCCRARLLPCLSWGQNQTTTPRSCAHILLPLPTHPLLPSHHCLCQPVCALQVHALRGYACIHQQHHSHQHSPLQEVLLGELKPAVACVLAGCLGVPDRHTTGSSTLSCEVWWSGGGGGGIQRPAKAVASRFVHLAESTAQIVAQHRQACTGKGGVWAGPDRSGGGQPVQAHSPIAREVYQVPRVVYEEVVDGLGHTCRHSATVSMSCTATVLGK